MHISHVQYTRSKVTYKGIKFSYPGVCSYIIGSMNLSCGFNVLATFWKSTDIECQHFQYTYEHHNALSFQLSLFFVFVFNRRRYYHHLALSGEIPWASCQEQILKWPSMETRLLKFTEFPMMPRIPNSSTVLEALIRALSSGGAVSKAVEGETLQLPLTVPVMSFKSSSLLWTTWPYSAW